MEFGRRRGARRKEAVPAPDCGPQVAARMRSGRCCCRHGEVAAVDRGLPRLGPHLLVGGIDAPGLGELDFAGLPENAVLEIAQTQRVADAELGRAAEGELGMADVAQGAFGVAALRLEVAAGAAWYIETQAAGHHPAQLVGGMAASHVTGQARAAGNASSCSAHRLEARSGAGRDAGAGAGHAGAVISAAGIVQGAADHGPAPGLVDAPVVDDVGHADGDGVVWHVAADEEGIGEGPLRVDAAVGPERPGDLPGHGGIGHADAARLFRRERAGDAVAEARGEGRDAPAAVTGIFRVGGEVGHRRRREEVEERLREAEGEAGELDEAAVGVEAFRGWRVTGVADDEVGSQHAVVGLLAGVDRDQRARSHGEVGLAKGRLCSDAHSPKRVSGKFGAKNGVAVAFWPYL